MSNAAPGSVAKPKPRRKPRPLKWLKNTFVYLAIRAAVGLVHLLPYSWGCALGRALGKLAFLVAVAERKRAVANLRRALGVEGPEATRVARRVFVNLGQGATEIANFHKIRDRLDQYVTLSEDDRRVLDDVRSRGRGVVWVTGHIGNWELMAASMAAMGYPAITTAKASYDPRLTRYIQRVRNDNGVETIMQGDPELKQKIAEVFRRGLMLGFLMDVDTKTKSTFVPFFSKLAKTPIGGAATAAAFEAPAVLGTIQRQGRLQHQIRIQELQLTGDLQQDTANWTQVIEQVIRNHPDGWIWMHDRWKSRPPAG